MVVSELTLLLVVAAVAGGALGAAIGALPALGIAGVVIVVGEVAELLFLDAPAAGILAVLGVDGTPLASAGPISAIGLGPVLGPHVAFAGGVGAAAFAGRKGTIDPSFRYHQAKQLRQPLFESPRNLLVGAIFGLLGFALATLAAWLALPFDPIAFAIVLTALLARLVFGYPLLGRFGAGGPFDMSPFENGAYWGDSEHDTADGIAGRHVVEPWQPAYYDWPLVVGLGVGVGFLSGALALLTESVYLPFGIALVALLALVAGVRIADYPIPVTHHIAFPAALSALAVAGGAGGSLLVAVVFGLIGALLAELFQRLFYAHGDTHVDPAFGSILLTSLLLIVLAAVGILEAGSLPY